MNEILHCPSRQRGAILGYHHGKKYYMVKTDTGQVQNWTHGSVQLLRKDYMTSKILIKLSGGPGKTFSVIERIFNTIKDAAEYIGELARVDGIKDYDKTGMVATLGNGWTIKSNYNIKEILKEVPPNKALWDWFPFDLQRKLAKKAFRRSHPSALPATEPTLTADAPKKKLTGKTVKLQDLTKDGRAARVILRTLVRQKKITKNGRWEWEEGSPDLELVRAAIAKGGKK